MNSSTAAPDYVLYRENIDAVDSVFNNPGTGINTGSYEDINVQVIPSGGADPTITVYAWSEAAEKFVVVADFTPVVGQGGNVAFEFSFRALGRKLMFAVTTLAAGSVDIYTSTFNLARGSF